jgi:hypothetical protein
LCTASLLFLTAGLFPPFAEMDERKAALVEALAAKCAALLELHQLEEAAAPAPAAPAADAAAAPQEEAAEPLPSELPTQAAFEAAFSELRKWVDTAADEKVGWASRPAFAP